MRLVARFVLFICLCAGIQAHAQEQQGRYFLKLEDGQIVQADKIQLKSPIFKTNHFLVNDSLKFNPASVSAFQNENGFYARIQPGNSYESFAKRTLDGPRIDRFSTTRDFHDYGYSPFDYGYGYGMPRTSRRRINFFSKDDGALYELNYDNLMQALADNEASVALLRNYKKDKLINTGVSVVGSGLLLLGAYMTTQDIQTQPNQQPKLNVSPVLYAGVGVLGAQFAINLFKKDKLSQAMEVYNYRVRE